MAEQKLEEGKSSLDMEQTMTRSDLEKLENPEVLYPDEFIAMLQREPPLSENNKKLWDDNKEYITIPIHRLSHITHNKEAQGIEKETQYEFKPQKKMGKTSGQCAGTYKKMKDRDSYQMISPKDEVFPGYLSWWGISISKWYENCKRGAEVKEALKKLEDDSIYAVSYLQSEAKSRYGNHAFVISLNRLMSSYKTSRQDKEICLKTGGTLCYMYENYYVIMVCVDGDEVCKTGNSMNESDIFVGNGYINDDGKVQKGNHFPCFHLKRAIKLERGKDYFSWDYLVFTFYFPEEKDCLKFDKEHVDHDPSIRHGVPILLKTYLG